MSIHVILLAASNKEVASRIMEQYPGSHEFSDTCYFVQTRDITRDVAQAVGVKGENRAEDASGAVFKLNGAYSGFTSRALWEWLSQAEELE